MLILLSLWPPMLLALSASAFLIIFCTVCDLHCAHGPNHDYFQPHDNWHAKSEELKDHVFFDQSLSLELMPKRI